MGGSDAVVGAASHSGGRASARLSSASCRAHSASSSALRPAQIGSPTPRPGGGAGCSSTKACQAGMIRAGFRPSSTCRRNARGPPPPRGPREQLQSGVRRRPPSPARPQPDRRGRRARRRRGTRRDRGRPGPRGGSRHGRVPGSRARAPPDLLGPRGPARHDGSSVAVRGRPSHATPDPSPRTGPFGPFLAGRTGRWCGRTDGPRVTATGGRTAGPRGGTDGRGRPVPPRAGADPRRHRVRRRAARRRAHRPHARPVRRPHLRPHRRRAWPTPRRSASAR